LQDHFCKLARLNERSEWNGPRTPEAQFGERSEWNGPRTPEAQFGERSEWNGPRAPDAKHQHNTQWRIGKRQQHLNLGRWTHQDKS